MLYYFLTYKVDFAIIGHLFSLKYKKYFKK